MFSLGCLYIAAILHVDLKSTLLLNLLLQSLFPEESNIKSKVVSVFLR